MQPNKGGSGPGHGFNCKKGKGGFYEQHRASNLENNQGNRIEREFNKDPLLEPSITQKA